VAAPAPVAKVETPVAIIAPAAAPTPAHEPQNIGELFNQADKTDWTPTELIKATCSLPGVAGAVIALEEGLVVAQKLPENLAADTMAAFMPQIFSRIDRYTGEMQLGDTSEVILQTAQGPCHFFRLGKVFFATLGRNGETLPAGLKLVAEEIARQNS
jgi:predicted regulator of Ras-like GTPase activity (Roadblock/LC7/MglB family)